MKARLIKDYLENGPKTFAKKIERKIKFEYRYRRCYLDKIEKKEYLNRINIDFDYSPLVSIVLPIFNSNEKWLRHCIESVLNQKYKNWELCIVDGGSTFSHVQIILQKYATHNRRIKIKFLKENKGIAGNSNEALKLASGEFIGFIDHDDELSPLALYEVIKLLNENKDADLIYSDEDKISEKNKRFFPHFKPDWSPDTFRSYNYISHFTVIRKRLIDDLGGFREGFEGSQDYDLFLRTAEKTQRIFHIPKVLYHWRYLDSSMAGNPGAKKYAYGGAKKALSEHVERLGLEGQVFDGQFLGSYRIQYLIGGSPSVSIIIANKDNADVVERCINSILKRSSYKNYKITIVDNGSEKEVTFRYYQKINSSQIKIISYNGTFNFSAVNNFAVSKINTEYIIFLNNDTEVISPNWIESMLEFAQRKDVGAVGALLYYPNGNIQHAGVIVGIAGFAGHSHRHFSRNELGYMGRAKLIQNLSAVTGACLLTKKTIFEEVGGFDENYSHALNDIDFCLKVREKGFIIVYTPYAELYHYESLSRGYEDTKKKKVRFKKEIGYFRKKWKEVLDNGDPYYNQNLTLDSEDFLIRK